MKYNYQIMHTKNEYGHYIPDMQSLKNNASCQEEIKYIEDVEKTWEEYSRTGHERLIGFTYNMCYVMRQACGHFEIFQTHVSDESNAIEWLKIMEEDSKKRKCTKCICGDLNRKEDVK